MDFEIYDNRDKVQLSRDAANLYFSLLDLCNVFDVDLTKYVEKRMVEISRRAAEWEAQYGDILSSKRDQFDDNRS